MVHGEHRSNHFSPFVVSHFVSTNFFGYPFELKTSSTKFNLHNSLFHIFIVQTSIRLKRCDLLINLD
jgi:hypothetical protein